jgi:hypothetical protein
MDSETMDVEMFICFDDGTWETMWVKIYRAGLAKDIDLEPKRRPWNEEVIKLAAREQVFDEYGEDGIAFYGVLPEFEKYEEDEVEDSDEYDEYEESEGESDNEEDPYLLPVAIAVFILLLVLWSMFGGGMLEAL